MQNELNNSGLDSASSNPHAASMEKRTDPRRNVIDPQKREDCCSSKEYCVSKISPDNSACETAFGLGAATLHAPKLLTQ